MSRCHTCDILGHAIADSQKRCASTLLMEGRNCRRDSSFPRPHQPAIPVPPLASVAASVIAPWLCRASTPSSEFPTMRSVFHDERAGLVVFYRFTLNIASLRINFPSHFPMPLHLRQIAFSVPDPVFPGPSFSGAKKMASSGEM